MREVPASASSSFEVAGHHVEVRRSARRRKTVTAYREGESVVVLVPGRMRASDVSAVVRDLVPKVLAKEARRRAPAGDAELTARGRRLSQRYLSDLAGGAPEPTSVTWVSNQQRRWGSCSVDTGAIRLSDRLRQMPSWVVDYVLLHEVVHLVHPDHSADFWDLVRRYPDTDRAQGYLAGWSDASPGGN
ncbi:M48 family metallopeptidase [Propionibacteriaceae bacterium Y2011]